MIEHATQMTPEMVAQMAAQTFAVGDRVVVCPGMAHEPEPEAGADGNPGTVKIVEGDAYGILFDGSDMVHKWYVASELMPAPTASQATRGDSSRRVIRYDAVGQLRAPRRTEGGRMRVDGVFTRAGVFEYRRADGSIQRELRPPDEVDASLSSLEMLPVVEDHPRDGLLRNDSRRAQGWTLEGVRRDGDLVIGSLMVTDPALVRSVEQGKRALSVGYEVEYDDTPGFHPLYGKYDGTQRKIRGDHLAVVDLGRAGPEARVRMDSVGTFLAPPATGVPSDLTRTDTSVNMTGKADTVDEIKKLQEALAAANSRADAAEKSVRELGARADAATGKCEALEADLAKAREDAKSGAEVPRLQAELAIATGKLEAAEKARADAADPKRFRDAVKVRTALEQSARLILGDKFRADLDDRDLMVAAVEKIYGPIQDRSSRSDDYIRAKFETAALSYATTEKHITAREVDRVVAADNRADGRSPREKFVAARQDFKPLSKENA